MWRSGFDFQFAERREGNELPAVPWGIGFGFGVLVLLTAFAIMTQVAGAKPYPATQRNIPRADETDRSENARHPFEEETGDTNQSLPTRDNGWRHSRTGWVQLAHEVGIGQQPLNWVQRMSPLVWAALLWSAATWILAWAE